MLKSSKGGEGIPTVDDGCGVGLSLGTGVGFINVFAVMGPLCTRVRVMISSVCKYKENRCVRTFKLCKCCHSNYSYSKSCNSLSCQ